MITGQKKIENYVKKKNWTQPTVYHQDIRLALSWIDYYGEGIISKLESIVIYLFAATAEKEKRTLKLLHDFFHADVILIYSKRLKERFRKSKMIRQ